MSGFFRICLLVAGLIQDVLASSSFLVTSPVGDIQGMEMTASNGQKYVGFQGIPYAKPPVGDLRFSKPEPHPVFESVFHATGPIVGCPHPTQLVFLEGLEPGQEECLILNIYTKELSKDGKIRKKVLVYIHGGGFFMGSSGEYSGGTFVTEQDIILVTINYRMGVLGFLSTENEASPGNYGLWDQILALKWVKDNIASFGGDPDDVTVSGQSAGGSSVALLSITPFTKGLFSKAFLLSGTATSIFSNALDAQFPALEVAKSANCWNGDINEKVGLAESQAIMKCLKELPLSELTKFSSFTVGKAQFVPCVDGEFIPQSPSQLIKDDQYLESVGFFDRSYLFGLVNNELTDIYIILERIIAHIMGMTDMPPRDRSLQVSNLLHEVKIYYTKSRLGIDDPPEALVNQIMDWYDRRFVNTSVSEMLTDLSFLIPTFDFTDTLARRNSKDVYLYYFNHYPAFMRGSFKGIPHCLELAYWFDISLEFMEKLFQAGIDGEMEEEDLELKFMFSSLIAQFAITGNPGKALAGKLPSGWPSYDLEGSHYLDLNPDPAVQTHLERARRKLWLETVPRWASELRKHPPHTEL